MNFNTDGFNERTNFIHNSNDKSRLNKMSSNKQDSSFVKMKISKNQTNLEIVNKDIQISKHEISGTRESFVLRNNNMRNANTKQSSNNPISNAINRNMFKKF